MLHINNLHISVDGKEIVKGVTLSIKPGEIHALMGPNGSGKSSLAMAIAGHPRYEVTKDEGRRIKEEGRTKAIIHLDGEDVANKTPDERARMGLFLAMQYPVGVGGITPEQLLRRAVQEIRKQSLKGPTPPRRGRSLSDSVKIDVLKFRKDLEKLAGKVGVSSELLHRSLNVGFSGGEKKRLEILQMLVLQPKYAILDETDSGLDVDALRTISENIRAFSLQRSAVSRKRSGVLVITHYAKLLDYLRPNYVHIMKDGKIIESGGKEVAERVEQDGYGGMNGNKYK